MDYPLLQCLSGVIILNNPLVDCRKRGAASDWNKLPKSKSLFHSPEGCGLPIDNLTSQLFSNVYMNRYDQYMKRELKCRSYGRYVDDSYVVSSSKAALREKVKPIYEFLDKELGLRLHPDKLVVCNALHGVGFLGAYLKPYRNYIHNDSLGRIKEGLEKLENVTDTERLRASLDSYLGVMSHYESFRLRRNLFCNQHHLFRYGYFGKGVLTFRCFAPVLLPIPKSAYTFEAYLY